MATYEDMSFNLTAMCPNMQSGQQIEGVDLQSLVDMTVSEYTDLVDVLETNVTKINETLTSIQSQKDHIVSVIDYTVENIWIVPGFLLYVAIVAFFSMLATCLALRGRSGPRFQRFMACVGLPLLLLACLGCCLATVGGSAASILVTGTSNRQNSDQGCVS